MFQQQHQVLVANLDRHLDARTLHTWRINPLQVAKERIENGIGIGILMLVPTGLRHPRRLDLIVSVNPVGR